jgi:hypothetical protein
MTDQLENLPGAQRPAGDAPRRRPRWKDFPLVVKIFLPLCALLLVLDLVIHRHVVHPWEETFGFYPLYGFVACVVLVLAATQMRRVLMRREDYYDAD